MVWGFSAYLWKFIDAQKLFCFNFVASPSISREKHIFLKNAPKALFYKDFLKVVFSGS